MAELDREAYVLPDPLSTMTLDFVYGINSPNEGAAEIAMAEQGFLLAGDLIASGYTREQVEAMVREGELNFAHWPQHKPVTDLLWDNREETEEALGKLASRVVEIAGSEGSASPEVTNFVLAGHEMESQQLALAGIIYACHKGMLRELPEVLKYDSLGPLYVVTGSFSDKMFHRLQDGIEEVKR